MQRYYSPSTGGFYNDQIHGPIAIEVPDPSVTHPTILVRDPEWTAPAGQPLAKVPLIEMPDPDWQAPRILVPNQACRIPADAVEITAEQHAELMTGQANGTHFIGKDARGFPVLIQREVSEEQVLATRDQLLAASDWVALRAAELGEPVPTPWREYRQALRDITEQANFPHDLTWPIEPE